METDLGALMRAAAHFCRPLAHAEIKTLMLMVLKGVAAVHEHRLMHRDLKPANVLLSPAGVLKLADFGLARVHMRNEQSCPEYSHEVATRWYRAPELLFGARKYGNEVDLWAVGCIFAELFTGSPLFAGENDIDQLYRVLRVLGTPDDKTWPEAKELPDFNKIVFPHMDAVPLSSLLPDVAADALSLISRFLVYPPAQRLTAADALHDDYFLTEPLPFHHHRLAEIVRLPRRMKRAHRSSNSRRPQFDFSAPLDIHDVGILRSVPIDG
jgi:cell cycle related kinase